MNNTLKLIACSIFLLPIISFAEDWYQIEVIAFQYIEPAGEPELWASHPGEPEWNKSMFLYDSVASARAHRAPEPVEVEVEVEEAAAEDEHGFVTVGQIVGADKKPEATKTINEFPFVSLSSRNFSMQGVQKTIEENPNYKILSHVAWRQPALSGRETENVRIYGGKELGKGPDEYPMWQLEGLITFKKSRFLHLEADVVLREPGASSSGSFESPQELGLLSNSSGRAYRAPNLTTYRMKQSQRVRSDRLYYYDHPLMGMIVKVSPYEPS